MSHEDGAAAFDDDTPLYHLVPAAVWQATAPDAVYFPATYEQDGFIHATADAALLLTVANHFYRDKPGDWLCLEMSVASVEATGVDVVFEAAAAVGDTPPAIPGVTAEQLFPHIFGGLKPSAILDVHAVTRTESGRFLAIGALAL